MGGGHSKVRDDQGRKGSKDKPPDGVLHQYRGTSEEWRETKLIVAISKGNTEELKSLIDEDHEGETLMMAALHGRDEVVNLLIDAKANISYINAVDKDECTALMKAARYGHYKCVEALVNAHADVGLRESDGWSAMMYAARHGYQDITQLLMTTDGHGTKGKHIRGKTIAILEQLQMDSVIEFIIQQFVETGLISSHWGDLVRFFPRIISRPGRSGEVLLKALYVEQKCPLKYQEARLPTNAPLTRMSKFQTMKHHSDASAAQKSSTYSIDTNQSHNLEANNEEALAKHVLHAKDDFLGIWEKVLDKRRRKSRVALFSCQVPGMVTPSIMLALAEAPSDEVLETGLARAIIEHAWRNTFVYAYLLEWLGMVGTLVVLCYLTFQMRTEAKPESDAFLEREIRVERPALIFFIVILAKSSLDELLEVYHAGRRGGVFFLNYCLSTGNVVDWLRMTTNFFAVWRMWWWQGTVFDRGVVSAMCGLLWFRVLYGLRPFAAFGPRLLPILFAVKDTVAFGIVMLFCTAATTHAYFVIGTRDQPSPLYASFLPMYRLVWLGDFDLYELEGEDTVYEANENGVLEPVDPEPSVNYVLVHVLFFIVCLCLTIAMLNLLVGILGANYERYESLSLPLFLRERANIINSLSCRFYGSLLWRKEWSANENEHENHNNMFLWAATRREDEPDPESERNIRTVINRAILKHVAPLSASLDQQKNSLQSLEASVKEQTSSLRTLEASVNEIQHKGQQKSSLESLEASVKEQKSSLQSLEASVNEILAIHRKVESKLEKKAATKRDMTPTPQATMTVGMK